MFKEICEPDFESFKLKLSIYKCRCNLSLRNSKACENELKNVLRNSEKVNKIVITFLYHIFVLEINHYKYCINFR